MIVANPANVGLSVQLIFEASPSSRSILGVSAQHPLPAQEVVRVTGKSSRNLMVA